MNRAISTRVSLENAALTMAKAGSFTWALGRLLEQVAEHDSASNILSEAIISGLSMGLQMVGATLQDDAEEYRQLTESMTNSATQNADSRNVSRGSGVEE